MENVVVVRIHPYLELYQRCSLAMSKQVPTEVSKTVE